MEPFNDHLLDEYLAIPLFMGPLLGKTSTDLRQMELLARVLAHKIFGGKFCTKSHGSQNQFDIMPSEDPKSMKLQCTISNILIIEGIIPESKMKSECKSCSGQKAQIFQRPQDARALNLEEGTIIINLYISLPVISVHFFHSTSSICEFSR
jgi:hypothetical protein